MTNLEGKLRKKRPIDWSKATRIPKGRYEEYLEWSEKRKQETIARLISESLTK